MQGWTRWTFFGVRWRAPGGAEKIRRHKCARDPRPTGA